jgi:hypothetical protein
MLGYFVISMELWCDRMLGSDCDAFEFKCMSRKNRCFLSTLHRVLVRLKPQ